MKARGLLITGLLVLVQGCSGLGNVLIGHHPNSMSETAGNPNITLMKDGSAVGAAGAAVVAQAAAIALKQLERAIDKESKRYKATYSARESGILCSFENGVAVPEIDSIVFDRKAKEKDKEVEGTTFSLDVQVTPDCSAILLTPTDFKQSKAKSKVAWASLYPWQWPATIIWAPWYLADRSIGKVDTNIQVTIDAIATDKNKERKLFQIGTLDFPMGKRPIQKLTSTNLPTGSLNPGYLPLPYVKEQPGKSFLPVNVTVTVMEANDLGDVIAKGSDRLKAKEDDLISALKKKLGLEKE